MENVINNRHLVRQAFQQAARFPLGDQQAHRRKWKKKIGHVAINEAESSINLLEPSVFFTYHQV
jgi:hypothetical protein